jgi:peptidoglycan hydrolase-like protein with peptidoglycan-binding domain
MHRRRFLLGLGGLAVVGAVPGALVLRGGGHETAATSTATGDRVTAKVVTRDLIERTDVTGTLGYSEPRQLALGAQGTITGLPALGTVVDRGGQLAEVDGRPVLLLFGERPLWRALAEGVTDGPDVEQLEANLIELGHARKSTLGPNQRWSEATTAAVKKWQKALGLDQTGSIEPGRAVFWPAALRVSKHVAEVGAPAGGPVLEVTGTTQTVHVDLAARKQALVHQGDAVNVVLPSGTTTAATITSIGTVAEAASGGQGEPTVPVTIGLTDPSAAGGLDQAPVTVQVTTAAAKGVLAVPVQALLALAEGGYALERVTGPTTTELAAVTLGASADGWIEVRGTIAAGDEVVTAK